MAELFDESLRKALLEEFLSENLEILRRLEGNLILLESCPDDKEWVHALFRDMHTIKGSCRMLGFEGLESLLHGAESLLGEYREGRGQMDRAGAAVLYRVVDRLGEVLPRVVAADSEAGHDFSELTAELHRLLMGEEAAAETGREEAEAEAEAEPGVSRRVTGEVEDRAVRLPMERLDFLINLIGELSAESNQLRYEFDRSRDRALQVMEAMEGRIHTLQDEVLKYRLQPIGRMWNSYHRLVRDLAVETGKRIVLETAGEQTQVDRSVLAVLKEVFGHLIRNAVDHGLESAAERAAAAKPGVGRIELLAEQRHGQVYLQVRDDGRGMDVLRIKEKAVTMGLLTPQQALEMADGEALRLIFEPGFTTAASVGRISGRGAGMDAVKVAVEKVRGVVEVESSPGVGTTIRLRIPQTMAIVPALMVYCDESWYALPEAQVVALLSFYGAEVGRFIEGKMGRPMVRVREGLLSLAPLSAIFQPRPRVLESVLAATEVHVVVLQGEGGPFALMVEAIGEIAHLVVKPLRGVLAVADIFAGAVVLADGRVSLLLDVVEVGRMVQNG